MRLRKLGTSQSLLFLATPEVHQSILDCRKKDTSDRIDSYDVVCWLLEQTCEGIEQLKPLYYSQGVDFCKRRQAAIDYPNRTTSESQRKMYLKQILQTEHQTLEELYRPRQKPKATTPTAFSPNLAKIMKTLEKARTTFQDTGNTVHSSALQEVEQEREIQNEVEVVREAKVPEKHSPLVFQGLHDDILQFATSGSLVMKSTAHQHAFIALRQTVTGMKHQIDASLDSGLYVTKEYLKTVKLVRPNDTYMVGYTLRMTESE